VAALNSRDGEQDCTVKDWRESTYISIEVVRQIADVPYSI
jgi:hypothetical protein